MVVFIKTGVRELGTKEKNYILEYGDEVGCCLFFAFETRKPEKITDQVIQPRTLFEDDLQESLMGFVPGGEIFGQDLD